MIQEVEKTLAQLTEIGHIIVLRDDQTGEIYTGKYNYIYRILRGCWVHTIAGKEVDMMNGNAVNETLEANCDWGGYTILENKTLNIKKGS
jgi:hypothetical protein